MRDPQIHFDCTADNHIHTQYCRHASGTMEEYVRAAIDVGLQRICFLEHMEVGISYFERVWLEKEDFDHYFQMGKSLQKKYRDQLTISLGVEVGYNPKQREKVLERLSKYSWDRVGLSYHFVHVPGYDYHLNLVSRKKENTSLFPQIGYDTLLENYFTHLIEAVDLINADFVCHLDAALRFQPDISFSEINWQQVNTLLDKIKKKNMSLEINTSGFSIRGEPFPSKKILKMAIEKDIQLVAGSDAHNPKDVGRFFDQLPNLLADIERSF